MRYAVLFILLFGLLAGCAPEETAAFAEHAQNAGMAHALDVTVYEPREDGTILTKSKRLPWQADMEEYVLSFVLPAPDVRYACRCENGLAYVDIAGFPTYADARAEGAALAAVVNTLLALKHIERVELTFDGETIPTLPHGTRVNSAFSCQIGATES